MSTTVYESFINSNVAPYSADAIGIFNSNGELINKIKIDGFKPFQNACIVDVTFYRHIPSSWSKRKRMEAACGIIRPITRPDCGNYEKGFYDALTGIIWVDDSIVTDKHVKKRYTADLARVELTVTEVQNEKR
jgi:Holliday junction resolvase RusA-like endonuclease